MYPRGTCLNQTCLVLEEQSNPVVVRKLFKTMTKAHTFVGLLLTVLATTLAAVACASAAICFMVEAATVAGFRVDVAMDRATTFDDA